MASPYDPNAGGQVPPPPGGYPGGGYPNSPHAQQGYTPQRPGTLTAAAVIAFVAAGFQIIGGILAMAGGALLGSAEGAAEDVGVDTDGLGGLIILLGILALGYGGFYIWGGVVAMSGKNSMVLTIVAALAGLTEIIYMIVVGPPSGLLGIAMSAVIVGLAMAPASREFVRAKGGKTF